MSDNVFQNQGFKVLKDFVEPTGLYAYINQLNLRGSGGEDMQVIGSKFFYKDVVFEKLLETIIPELEVHTGFKLFKTYSFARVYNLENELLPHQDRDACEITVSLLLGYEGESWPIWLRDKNNKNLSFKLEPGDALVFKGIEHLHWREKNTYGPCAQVFLHYVNQDGTYAGQKDDKENI